MKRYPVFGRVSKEVHRYEEILAEWLARRETVLCAMCRNIMHDHRVPEARAQAFDAYGGKPAVASELQAAFVDYYREQVQQQKTPAFLYPENGPNILTGRPGLRDTIPSTFPLARVLDLTGLGKVFSYAMREGAREFRDFTPDARAGAEQAGVNEWLSQRLTEPRRQEETLGAIFDAMGRYRRALPYQPAWVSAWGSFEEFKNEEPRRWLETVGVYRGSYPRWVVVLKYSVGEAGTLVRPTQLESGWNAYHFPSPPQFEDGGLAMDLAGTRQAMPEFVHQEIDLSVDYWVRGGRLCKATDSATQLLSEQCRKRHFRFLVSTYGPEVKRWMPGSVCDEAEDGP